MRWDIHKCRAIKQSLPYQKGTVEFLLQSTLYTCYCSLFVCPDSFLFSPPSVSGVYFQDPSPLMVELACRLDNGWCEHENYRSREGLPKPLYYSQGATDFDTNEI